MAKGLANLVSGFGATIKRNSPQILTGVAVIGVMGTVVCAGHDTIKARDHYIYEETQRQEAATSKEELEKRTPLEIVKANWKFYIPTAVCSMATIGCIIGSNVVAVRRGAALASAYTIASTALNDYKDKVKDIIGEKKAEEITDKVMSDAARREAPKQSEAILTEEDIAAGRVKCKDYWSSREFIATPDFIKRVEAEVQKDLMTDDWISLNEIYDRLGIEGTGMGENMGWTSDMGLHFKLSSSLTENDEPILVVSYSVAPVLYSNVHGY